MVAEMISSAVVGETLNRVVSRLLTGCCHREDDGSVERLEMAHSRMEAVLELSTRWPITDVSLLRWRRRLKRAAGECDGALHHRKQRAVEDEAASRSSLPRRVAHATRSLVSALIGSHNDDDGKSSSSSSAAAGADVRRFERLADGAGEFLKLVELGGTRPRQHSFFDPLIGRLLAGETLSYLALRGSKLFYLGVRPVSFEERGVEAMVGFVVQDFMAPARSFRLGLMVRLSERTDVIGVMINCMQSATPHFRLATEDIRRELAQQSTQDFYRVDAPYHERQYWMDVHTCLAEWFRPNPLCCNNDVNGGHIHHHHHRISSSCSFITSSPSSVSRPLFCTYPEQVMVVHLQCHIPAPDDHGEEHTPLKLSILFTPHDTPEEEKDMVSAAFHDQSSYAFEVIDEEEQDTIHGGACLHDVHEKLLPKAVDYLCKNEASRTYQVCLKSSHGTAHLCVDKSVPSTATTPPRRSTRRRIISRSETDREQRGEMVVAGHKWRKKVEEYSIQGWQESARDLLKLWVVRKSDRLHDSIRSWTETLPDVKRRTT